MEKALNGWTVLLILVMLAMGFAFATWQTKTMIPQAAAQIASNAQVVEWVTAATQDLVTQVNAGFVELTKRVDALEEKK